MMYEKIINANHTKQNRHMKNISAYLWMEAHLSDSHACQLSPGDPNQLQSYPGGHFAPQTCPQTLTNSPSERRASPLALRIHGSLHSGPSCSEGRGDKNLPLLHMYTYNDSKSRYTFLSVQYVPSLLTIILFTYQCTYYFNDRHLNEEHS